MIRVSAGLLLVLVIVGAPHAAFGASPSRAVARSTMEGEWRLDPEGDDGHVKFTLERRWRSGSGTSSWVHTDDIRPQELVGITDSQWSADDARVSFQLVHRAGRFRCEGRLHHGRGSGRFVFEPDADYRKELEGAGLRNVTSEDLIRLCFHDVDLELLRSFKTRGRHPTIDELIRLAVHGITPEYVAEMSAAGRVLDAEELVRMKVHGIEPSYVRDLTMAGRERWTADDIVRLKVHGVEASFPREVESLGYPVTPADLVRMRVHGIRIDWLRGLHELGYARLDTDDLIRLHVNGVTPSWIRRAHQRHGKLSVEDLIRLKHRGSL